MSVLLPFRNATSTLKECLDSIQRQSVVDFEVLAVDDGSTDSSSDLIASRARADPRIRLLTNPGCGLVSALNYGLRAARTPLIARMDADDRMHPERLAIQQAALEADPSLSLVGCQVRLFPEVQVQAGYREYVAWQNRCLTAHDMRDEIYVESPLAHPSVTFRRSQVVALGGYREGPFPEDYDLWLRMVHGGLRLAKVPRILLDWREGGRRLSRVDPRCAREAFDRLRAEYLARDRRLQRMVEEGRALVCWGAGRKTRRRTALLLDRGYTTSAWIDIDPRKIGNHIAGVPVVPPAWLARAPRPFVLCYVTNHGARDLIAASLRAMGYQRGRDYLMVG